MRGLHYALLAGAALLASTSAQAATTITFGDGTGGLSAGEMLYASFSPGSLGTITSGSNYAILTGSISGVGADPAVGGQGDPYLSVGTPGAGNITFDFSGLDGGGASQLGLDFGSADLYNTFILNLSNGMTESYSGQDVINFGLADGNQQASDTNGRLTFNTDPGIFITSLQLTSTQAALEVDNFGVIAAVPEPGTWGMMLLGFGAMGVSLRRRRRRSPPILAQAL